MGAHSSFDRMYFFVSPHGLAWDVSVEQETPISFADRETAVEAAVSGADRIWKDFRQCTGVRIMGRHGWRLMRTFGG
jgi:hypothetical protein